MEFLLKNSREMNKLSICCITFNQDKFVAQAIDGFLNQRVNFDTEIIIGDDSSADCTAKICEEYQSKYPERIKLIKNKINIGMGPNFTQTLLQCSGEYIAVCEGDDYWTDPYKLQKQVDFLDANLDFAICFHNSRILNEEAPEITSFSNPQSQREINTFEDLAHGEFIYTATCVFRNANFKKYPTRFDVFLNNYTLDLHNAQFGKIKYINEVMSVYRKHMGGVWSMVAREKTLMNQLPTYKFYINYFDKKYKHYFIRHVQNITNELISIIVANKDYKNFWRYYKDFVYYNIRNRNKFKRIAYIFLKANYDRTRQLMAGNE